MKPARRWAVLGGGLVGCATALRLQEAGFEVVLVDRGDVRRGASFGNIGHIAAEQCEPMPSAATLKTAFGRLFAFGGPLDFRARDIGLWAPWALRFLVASRPAGEVHGARVLGELLDDPLASWKRLAELANAPDDLIDESGHAVVWTTERAAQNALSGWMTARTGRACFRPMQSEELSAYESVMTRRPAGGIRFSGTGQVSEPQRVRDVLLKAFADRGGQLLRAEVDALRAIQSGAVVAMSDGAVLEFDAVVVSAGAWSSKLLSPLGVRVPLIGERGYSVQSAEHDWPKNLPLTVVEDHALVLSRFRSGLRASSHVEFGDPSAGPDPRKWAQIEMCLEDLGVRFSGNPDRWCGPRPTLPDYLPAIGRLQAHPQIHYAFGHQHLGLTLAARTAEIVLEMAVDGKAEGPAALRIERF